MGRPLPTCVNKQILVERHQTRCGQHRAEEGGDFTISRLKDSWTPWNNKNCLAGVTRLLVAKHEGRHYQLCTQMRHMSK